VPLVVGFKSKFSKGSHQHRYRLLQNKIRGKIKSRIGNILGIDKADEKVPHLFEKIKRMKISFFSALILLTSFLFMECENKTIQSNWIETSIIIDGDSDDWPEQHLEYFEERKLVAGVINDQNNVYLLFRINDRVLARRSLLTTITVWFDATNRKKKDFGISYPGYSLDIDLESEKPTAEDLRGGFWESLTEEQKERLRKKRTEMHGMIRVIEKFGDKDELIPPGGEKGPAVGYSYEKSGIHTYELRIPFNGTAGNRFGINVDPGDRITLGFELGKGASDNLRRMTGVGRPGGGWRGGMERGGMSRQAMRSNPELWITVILATMSRD